MSAAVGSTANHVLFLLPTSGPDITQKSLTPTLNCHTFKGTCMQTIKAALCWFGGILSVSSHLAFAFSRTVFKTAAAHGRV